MYNPTAAQQDKQNLNLAQHLLLKACTELGLQTSAVQVVEIKNQTRWVICFDQAFDKPNFGHSMIKLERWIRKITDQEIELQLESTADRNKREHRSGRGEKLVNARNVESLDS